MSNPSKTKPDYRVHCLRDGQRDVVKLTAVKHGSRTVLLMLCADGLVCSSANRDMHLVEAWSANDAMRRAWCKLTGHSLKDLNAIFRKNTEETAKREALASLLRLRRQAELSGYRLVKTKNGSPVGGVR